MTRYLFFVFIAIVVNTVLRAQTDKYPVPEYSNEINLLKKDSNKLLRLEKGNSKLETKVKMMGFGGMNNGYELDDEKSTVRLNDGKNLVFVLYTGGTNNTSSPQSDSMMRANGMDPSTYANAMSMFTDPTKNTSLYEMKSEKGKRKITLMSAGMLGKKKESTKYTLSIKKVKDGYYEILVDKSLPKGEYSFVMTSMSMDQSYALFAFGID